MSVCEHDAYCPGYGPEHDIAQKLGTATRRDGRSPGESMKAWKRRERAERKARGDAARWAE